MHNVRPLLLLAIVVLLGTFAYIAASPFLEADDHISRCDDYDPSYSPDQCDDSPTP